MPYTSNAALQAIVSRIYSKLDATKMPTHLNEIVIHANERAQAEIKRVLLGRGFTLSQIETWFGLDICNQEVGTFYSVQEIGGLKASLPEPVTFYARWLYEPTLGYDPGLLATTELRDASGALIVPADPNGPLAKVGGKLDFCGYEFSPDMSL